MKERKRVLVADKIDQAGLDVLSKVAEIEVRNGMQSSELENCIGNYEALIVRSATQCTKNVLEKGAQGRLKIVARAGVGIDNVDVGTATQLGIPVVNSPTGNVLAAAEHTIALMLSLARNIPEACALSKQQQHFGEAWKSRSQFVGDQMNGKALGIIGFGKVGQIVSKIAGKGGLGMHVIAYDPFLSADRVITLGADECLSVEDLLKKSDFVTIHVPLTDKTRGFINSNRLSLMKPTSKLINASRGGVIDEDALLNSLKSNRISGAALDVLSEEPPSPAFIQAASQLGKRLILTPHLGASTKEAQKNVSVDVAEQVAMFLESGENAFPPSGTVNIPTELRLPGVSKAVVPWMKLSNVLTQLAMQLFDDTRVLHLNVTVTPNSSITPGVAVASACVGLLSVTTNSGSVSIVNAVSVAESRGITISSSTMSKQSTITKNQQTQQPTVLEVSIESHSREKHSVSGLVESERLWLLSVDNFRLLVPISSMIVFIKHKDTPGVIGSVGFQLGKDSINIESMVVGRHSAEKSIVGSDAVMVICVDDPPKSKTISKISNLENVLSAKFIQLPGVFSSSSETSFRSKL